MDKVCSTLTEITGSSIADLSLPARALLALAGRCAQRVRPLFAADWNIANGRQIDAVKQAVWQAESTASPGLFDLEAAVNGMDSAKAVGGRLIDSCSGIERSTAPRALAAYHSALAACRAAGDFCEMVLIPAMKAYDKEGLTLAQQEKLGICARPMAKIQESFKGHVEDAIRTAAVDDHAKIGIARDFQFLCTFAGKNKLSNEVGIAPHQFGRMWSKATPIGWPSPPTWWQFWK